jgi:hypothetical protein
MYDTLYLGLSAERATKFFLSFSFFLCFPWGGVLNRPRKCQGRRWWEYGGGQYGRAHRVAERMTFSKAPRPKQRFVRSARGFRVVRVTALLSQSQTPFSARGRVPVVLACLQSSLAH